MHMANRTSAPEKRPGFFSQIKSLFKFTREIYPWLPWAQIALLVLGMAETHVERTFDDV